ncbi:MAG: SDR family NAD(P)-dependent oxidoreductase [Candidatus Lokiarchaeota archaeon]|nr:SDR family NAD(P)-dependent oxidoreductase [Candidatus Lokiarchaeota archaeon]
MKDFKNKVAVITGAASGIGLGLAKYCVKKGIKTVLSDIEEELLLKVTDDLKDAGGDVIPVIADVSSLEEVKNLADQTLKEFGKINLLFNNAGVIPGTNILKNTIKDFEWVIGVNLWGVIYGVNTFLPIMFEQSEESHIVNTSSGSAFFPGNGAYDITKYGVTALSENMRIVLKKIESNVSVSLLIPGIVDTGIVDSNRNRPQNLKNPSKGTRNWDDLNKRLEEVRDRYRGSMSPDLVADMTFDAIEKDIFYIFTEMGMKEGIDGRYKWMLGGIDALKKYLEKNNLGG